ncbi:helix-turn-helix transcriptional regulator [Yinghuangia soli]|uniref:AAA family ATPase n=1 Tax=Yinghuangia soli TaxID=2908204 RepID=A0AA41U0N0_9ACTN|nr:AAA family ATPase [Yinghuangia soli]MCF2526577.1 AAA family ATPase [Yinghuangia soli]
MLPYAVYRTPFVGRTGEIARIDEALQRARAGDPRALLVAGEAGVGKTRLLEEATEHAADVGMNVLVGHCVDLGDGGLPYFPFTEILRAVEADPALSGVLDHYTAVQRLLRDGAAAAGDESRGAGIGVRLRLLEEVATLLADLAERAPVMVVIEDLHWADQSTRDLLRFLLSRLLPQRNGGPPQQRLAIVATYRSDDLHRRHPLRPLLAELVRLPAVARLDLGPLGDADVSELVRLTGTEALPDETVRRIVERAEGNAFYAEELSAAAADDGLGGLPPGLAEVLLTRIEQLSSTAQRVLRTAAAAGRRVEHGLLRDAVELPDDEVESALREAVGRHLLVADTGGAYTFRHALLRDAAYRDLLPGERVRIHASFARLLADEQRKATSAAERAHHHRESHDLPGAFAASLEAADHAARVGAPAEELRHVEAALELFDAVPDAAERAGADDVTLILRASSAAVRMGEAHRAVALAREALGRVGSHADNDMAAKVRYTLASSLFSVDMLESAYDFSSQALDLIPTEPPTTTWLWAAATHVQAAFYVKQNDVVRELGAKVIEAADKLGSGDAKADVMITMTAVEPDNRKTRKGREKLQQARELARAAGNNPIEMRALFNLGMGAHESGDLVECLAWLDEGMESARRAAQTTAPYPLDIRYLRALTLYTLGRWDDALETVPASAPTSFGYVAEAALYVPLGRGEPGTAERAEALYHRRPPNWTGTLLAGIVLVDEASLRGDAAAAVAWAHRALADLRVDAPPMPAVGVRLAALALSAIADTTADLRLTGRADEAGSWTEAADELAELAHATDEYHVEMRPSGPEGVAWLLRVDAERARVDGVSDPEQWAAVVAAFDYGNVYEQARARVRLAEALLTADRRAEASAEVEEVRAVADRLGARPLRAAVDILARRGRLGAAGAAAGPAHASGATGAAGALRGGPEAGDLPVLTGREREVLEQLALGRTNRQIGEALFISTKTASVHVSNILAKVGAASRTEAVAQAYRLGLIPPP